MYSVANITVSMAMRFVIFSLSLLIFIDASDFKTFVAFTNNCTESVQITRRTDPVQLIHLLKPGISFIHSISSIEYNTFTAGADGLTEAVFVGRRFRPLRYGISVARGFDVGMQILPINTFSDKVRQPLTCTNATCAESNDGVPQTNMTEEDKLASNFEITFCPESE